MNNVDLNVYRHAQALANSGQMSLAVQMFRELRSRNSDVEILFGIATTTPDLNEMKQMIDDIRQAQPYHPQLSQLEALYHQKLQGGAYIATSKYIEEPLGPILLCPYCGQRAHVIIRHKLSTAGWVVLLLLLFTTIILFWIGLFFQEQYYVCSRCGSRIATAQ